MSSTYTLTLADPALGTAEAFTGWVRDRNDDLEQCLQADALVASGDYFMTLATELDKLAQVLPSNSGEQILVEELVDTLLYLDKNYAIARKSRTR